MFLNVEYAKIAIFPNHRIKIFAKHDLSISIVARNAKYSRLIVFLG